MSSFFKLPAAIFCAYFGALAATGAGALAENTGSSSDAELQMRVQQALHADRYFYDGHVEVTVDRGVVYLRGLVFSDWDLREAKRIAAKAADNGRIVNDLTLIEGGRR
jgi:osmotically-inducible protein OsmY